MILLMNNLYGLPQINTSTEHFQASNGVSNLPSNIEYFAGKKHSPHGHGHKTYHHLRPGMRGLAGRWGPYAYGPYDYPYRPIQPVYVQQTTTSSPTCGGSNCNAYYNEYKKDYEISPNVQCTCCAKGKSCRVNDPDVKAVKYQDCCAGLKCKNGTCS